MWQFSKNHNSKPAKLLQWQLLTFWNQPKLISRKIRVAGELLNTLGTMEFLQSKSPIRLPWSVQIKFWTNFGQFWKYNLAKLTQIYNRIALFQSRKTWSHTRFGIFVQSRIWCWAPYKWRKISLTPRRKIRSLRFSELPITRRLTSALENAKRTNPLRLRQKRKSYR